jgi:hypothetical protein
MEMAKKMRICWTGEIARGKERSDNRRYSKGFGKVGDCEEGQLFLDVTRESPVRIPNSEAYASPRL